VATLNLTVTERDGATFKRKELWATEEVMATITVGAIFFLLGA